MPFDAYAGREPPIGSPTRNAMTATVFHVWMDDTIPRRRPEGWNFFYAGAIVSFEEDQFDEHIGGNDPPGEGPAAYSGDCDYNFVSEEWTNCNGVLMDTKTPVPVVYLMDAQLKRVQVEPRIVLRPAARALAWETCG